MKGLDVDEILKTILDGFALAHQAKRAGYWF